MSHASRVKWALVTGASSGIGAATAMELAKKGYHLFLIARRQEKLNEIRKQILLSQPQIKIEVFKLDVSVKTQVHKFVNQFADQLKNLSILVNNAGLAKGSDAVQNGNIDDWEQMIDVNLKGLLYFTKELLPFLIANKEGHVINLGSVAGRWVYPGGAVYCATKHAVRAISEGLRMDLLGKNIRVTNIEPGMVNTEFSLVRFGDQKKADQVYDGMTPLTATDIAETIAWIIDRPNHVNVQEIVIYPTAQASVRDVYRMS